MGGGRWAVGDRRVGLEEKPGLDAGPTAAFFWAGDYIKLACGLAGPSWRSVASDGMSRWAQGNIMTCSTRWLEWANGWWSRGRGSTSVVDEALRLMGVSSRLKL